MVDRRIRYLNSAKGKLPAPGGGRKLLEELESSELDEPPKKGALALRPVLEDLPVAVDPLKSEILREEESAAVGAPTTVFTQVAPAPDAHAARSEAPRVEGGGAFSGGAISPGGLRHAGTVLSFERMEALRGEQTDSREKMISALKQLLDGVAAGDLPWELLKPDFGLEADPVQRSVSAKPIRDSRQTGLQRVAPLGSRCEIVVPLGEAILRGHALVACPGWFLLMLLFLAAACLAMIGEQGFLHAGLFTHFLESRLWVFVKLGLVCCAALAAVSGLFHSSLGKSFSGEKAGQPSDAST